MFQEKSIETCILSRVKQITSPGWMHETRARTWCTGKTQRDRVEREVGGGIGMGNTCTPMAVSFQCMTKFTTNKKKKAKKKIIKKINKYSFLYLKKKKKKLDEKCGLHLVGAMESQKVSEVRVTLAELWQTYLAMLYRIYFRDQK